MNIVIEDEIRKYLHKMPDFKNIDTPGKIRALHSAVVEATKPW